MNALGEIVTRGKAGLSNSEAVITFGPAPIECRLARVRLRSQVLGKLLDSAGCFAGTLYIDGLKSGNVHGDP